MNALDRIGAPYILSDDKEIIDHSSRLILPGVGHAAAAMDQLKSRNLIATLKNYLKSDNPRIQNLEAKKASLENQISSQSGRLAAHKGSTLADMTQEYEAHKLMTEFAIKRYSTAIVGLEEARAKAAQQMKYLLRVTGPTKPEKSTKPEPLKEILGTFFVTLVTFTIGGLILSALKDHIRS